MIVLLFWNKLVCRGWCGMWWRLIMSRMWNVVRTFMWFTCPHPDYDAKGWVVWPHKLPKGLWYEMQFPICMERMWLIWHNYWRKKVHVSLGIWMWSVCMHFTIPWVTWTLVKFLVIYNFFDLWRIHWATTL